MFLALKIGLHSDLDGPVQMDRVFLALREVPCLAHVRPEITESAWNIYQNDRYQRELPFPCTILLLNPLFHR